MPVAGEPGLHTVTHLADTLQNLMTMQPPLAPLNDDDGDDDATETVFTTDDELDYEGAGLLDPAGSSSATATVVPSPRPGGQAAAWARFQGCPGRSSAIAAVLLVVLVALILGAGVVLGGADMLSQAKGGSFLPAPSLPAVSPSRAPLPSATTSPAPPASLEDATAAVLAACNTTALFAAARAKSALMRTPLGRAPSSGGPNGTDDDVEVDAGASHCDPLARSLHANALIALEGQHIVMVGDSIMRYSYLSFGYWLRHGSWSSPPPVNTREKAWPNWHTFYNVTTDRLGGGTHEICDCYRPEQFEAQYSRESRYMLLPSGKSRLSFITWFGDNPTGGRNTTTLGVPCLDTAMRTQDAAASCPQQSCRAGECASSPSLPGEAKGALPGLLRSLIPPLKPTVLVLNCGLWCGCPGCLPEAEILSVIRDVRAALAPAPLRVIWRTTTQESKQVTGREPDWGRPEESPFLAQLLADRVDVFDARVLTAHAADAVPGSFWDYAHPVAPLYSLLNWGMIGCIVGGACS